MSAWPWIGAGVVMLMGSKRSKKKASSPTSSTSSTSSSSSRAEVVAAGVALGLPEVWIHWLVWVSKGESAWKRSAWNHSSGERAAAVKAHNRLVGEGRFPCPPDLARFGIGSGGWYGQLAPYTAFFLDKAGAPAGLVCDPRAAWLDAIASTVAHLAQVDGTVSILRNKAPAQCETFLALRALYGLPSRDPCTAIADAARRAQYTNTLKSAGIDPKFLDQRVPNLPEPNLPAGWGGG